MPLPIRPIYQRRRNHALGKRPLVAAAGKHVPLARRFADGPAAAVGQPALVRQRRQQSLAGARSAGAARPAAFARLGDGERQRLRPAGRPRAVVADVCSRAFRRPCRWGPRRSLAATLKQVPGIAPATEARLAGDASRRGLARSRRACRRDAHRRADFADHPHGALRGSPRRPHARLHAAGCPAGRLPEPRREPSKTRPKSSAMPVR